MADSVSNHHKMLYYLCRSELDEFEAVFDQIMATACLISNLIEFVLFIIIISELLKLHTGRFARSNRRPNVAKKNAITGLGHFLSWLMEFLLFGICQVLVMAHR